MTETTPRPRLSTATKALAAGLFVTAAGITTQFVSGVPGFPSIPPGPFITAGAGLAVLLLPWRWTPAIGLGTALFIFVGAIVATIARDGQPLEPLSTPGAIGPFAGVVVHWVGMLVALTAGIAAVRHITRRP